MPDNVRVIQVLFFYSPEYTDININATDNVVRVSYPLGFPTPTLCDATIAMLSQWLKPTDKIIVKCNCLGFEYVANAIRNRFYCKCVGVLHCLPHCSYNRNNHFPQNPFFNMDAVISVCDTGRDYMNIVKNTRPVHVIYNGIDCPRIKKSKKQRKTFTFLFANGWATHKGMSRIIPAIRDVATKRDIRIIVLGGGTPDDDTAEQIADLPIENIGLITNATDITQYYEQSDCALFASYSEACSFAGIEAMAHNMPIISTNAVGLREMFGGAAIYVPENDKRELDTTAYASAMLRIIDSPRLRTKLSVLAYSRYLQRYTAKQMVRETLKLYNNLLN